MKNRLNSLTRILAGGALLAASTLSYGTPLNLDQNFPDFSVFNISYNFSFDGDGGQLTAVGDPTSFTQTEGGDQHPVTNSTGLFTLTADIDGAGNVLSGSFDLNGIVRDLNNFPNVLYDGTAHPNGLMGGNLTEFGFANSGGGAGVIEFRFNNIDGLISDQLGPFFSGGTIMTLSSSTMTNLDVELLTTNWTGSGFADVFVPIPAAAWMFMSGLIGLVGVARRSGRDR